MTPAKNLWHCLGACGRGGGPIDWVMTAQGVSFRHAVELLRESSPALGVLSQTRPWKGTGPATRSSTAKLPSLVEVDAADQELLNTVVGYYAETLATHDEASGFLTRRRIDHPEVVERFRLGFGDRTLGYRIPGNQTAEGKRIRSRLQALGILRSTGHEHLGRLFIGRQRMLWSSPTPGRFWYRTRGPDFVDRWTGEMLELTTSNPGTIAEHLARPGYANVTICTYALPAC